MTIIRKDEEFYGGISIGQSFIYENQIYIKTTLRNKDDLFAINLEDGSSKILLASARVRPITAKVLVD